MKNSLRFPLFRVCGSCERVYLRPRWVADECPVCGFGYYDAVWAYGGGWRGLRRAVWELVTGAGRRRRKE